MPNGAKIEIDFYYKRYFDLLDQSDQAQIHDEVKNRLSTQYRAYKYVCISRYKIREINEKLLFWHNTHQHYETKSLAGGSQNGIIFIIEAIIQSLSFIQLVNTLTNKEQLRNLINQNYRNIFKSSICFNSCKYFS